MKLILSSCDFTNENSRKVILNNIDKSLDKCKTLFIPNEKASLEKINSDKYYKRLYDYGFTNKNNIYIFNHYEPDSFRNLNIDLLYISGGNTFATLDKIRKAKFYDDIINYIKNGVVYIGGSCGAHIVSKNVKHVENFDENKINLNNYDGLGLFDDILIVHYDDERKKLKAQITKENNYKVYTLTNNESLVVSDGEIIKYK